MAVTYDEERRIATLTGKAPGTTNINVVTTEGLISNVKVSVKQPSTALNLTPKDVTLKTGDSVNLKATFTPANSTDTIVWKSYNTGVATVDTNGRVTGVKSRFDIYSGDCLQRKSGRTDDSYYGDCAGWCERSFLRLIRKRRFEWAARLR